MVEQSDEWPSPPTDEEGRIRAMMNWIADKHTAWFRRCAWCSARGGRGHVVHGLGHSGDFVCIACMPDPDAWLRQWLRDHRPPAPSPSPPGQPFVVVIKGGRT